MWRNKNWAEFLISLPHQISQMAQLILDPGRHLNPMITRQKITMWLVQLHTISPHHRPPTRPLDCLVQSGWLIVFYTDLRIFRQARVGGKLGQHKETDILSGPRGANVIRWHSVRAREVSHWGKCRRYSGAFKMPLDTSLSERNIVCISPELLPFTFNPTIN